MPKTKKPSCNHVCKKCGKSLTQLVKEAYKRGEKDGQNYCPVCFGEK